MKGEGGLIDSRTRRTTLKTRKKQRKEEKEEADNAYAQTLSTRFRVVRQRAVIRSRMNEVLHCFAFFFYSVRVCSTTVLLGSGTCRLVPIDTGILYRYHGVSTQHLPLTTAFSVR